MGEILRDGRWDEVRMSADRGNVAVSLTHGKDEPVQRFATTLTADRNCTVQNLDSQGVSPRKTAAFRIVRLAGGAFNLVVQDSTPTLIKNVPAASWLDIMIDDAGVWRATAFGAL